MTPLLLFASCVIVVGTVIFRAAWNTKMTGPRGEYWFAEVPFEDGTGSKDRPVLVLGYRGGSVKVLTLTSQDQSARRGYVKVNTSDWATAGRHASWLRMDRVVTLDSGAMRRRAGYVGTSTWSRVVARHFLVLILNG